MGNIMYAQPCLYLLEQKISQFQSFPIKNYPMTLSKEDELANKNKDMRFSLQEKFY